MGLMDKAGERIRTVDVQLGKRSFTTSRLAAKPFVFNSLPQPACFRKPSHTFAFLRDLWQYSSRKVVITTLLIQKVSSCWLCLVGFDYDPNMRYLNHK